MPVRHSRRVEQQKPEKRKSKTGIDINTVDLDTLKYLNNHEIYLHDGQSKRYFVCQVCGYRLPSCNASFHHLGRLSHSLTHEVMDAVPVLLHLPPIVEAHRIVLNNALEKGFNDRCVKENELKRRQAFADKVVQFLEAKIPDIRILRVGSTWNGLAMRASDVNLSVYRCSSDDEVEACGSAIVANNNAATPTHFDKTLRSLGASQLLSLVYDELKLIGSTESPRKSSPEFKPNGDPAIYAICDINHGNPGIEFTDFAHVPYLLFAGGTYDDVLDELFRAYYSWSPLALRLVSLFREFCEDARIDKPMQRTFYRPAIKIMVIFYLQHCKPPVLPNLHLLYRLHRDQLPSDSFRKVHSGGEDLSFLTDSSFIEQFFDESASNSPSCEKRQPVPGEDEKSHKSLGDLWLGLLRFYTLDFQYKRCAIDIVNPEPVLLAQGSRSSAELVVRDPFNPEVNLCKSLGTCGIQFLRSQMLAAYAYFGVPRRTNGDHVFKHVRFQPKQLPHLTHDLPSEKNATPHVHFIPTIDDSDNFSDNFTKLHSLLLHSFRNSLGDHGTHEKSTMETVPLEQLIPDLTRFVLNEVVDLKDDEVRNLNIVERCLTRFWSKSGTKISRDTPLTLAELVSLANQFAKSYWSAVYRRYILSCIMHITLTNFVNEASETLRYTVVRWLSKKKPAVSDGFESSQDTNQQLHQSDSDPARVLSEQSVNGISDRFGESSSPSDINPKRADVPDANGIGVMTVDDELDLGENHDFVDQFSTQFLNGADDASAELGERNSDSNGVAYPIRDVEEKAINQKCPSKVIYLDALHESNINNRHRCLSEKTNDEVFETTAGSSELCSVTEVVTENLHNWKNLNDKQNHGDVLKEKECSPVKIMMPEKNNKGDELRKKNRKNNRRRRKEFLSESLSRSRSSGSMTTTGSSELSDVAGIATVNFHDSKKVDDLKGPGDIDPLVNGIGSAQMEANESKERRSKKKKGALKGVLSKDTVTWDHVIRSRSCFSKALDDTGRDHYNLALVNSLKPEDLECPFVLRHNAHIRGDLVYMGSVLQLRDCKPSTMTIHSDCRNPQCDSCGKIGHSGANCPNTRLVSEALELWKKKLSELPKQLPSGHIDALTNCLNELASFHDNSSQESQRGELVAVLQKLFKTYFPSVTLSLFGSCANGFELPSSDMDLCVFFPEDSMEWSELQDPVDAPRLIGEFKRFLHLNSAYLRIAHLRAVLNAKVPILKVRFAAGYEVDISFSNYLAVHNTRMLKFYTVLDSALRPLGIALKILGKLCHISNASIGGISSYALIIMLIHYLQQRDILPVLQELYDSEEKPISLVNGWNVWFQNDMATIDRLWNRPQFKTPLGDLWLGFFRYYLFEFKRELQVVTIRQKAVLTRLDKLWSSLLAVEDPFNLEHNLTGSLTRNSLICLLDVFYTVLFHHTSPIPKEMPIERWRYQLFCPDSLAAKRHTTVPTTAQCRYCHEFGHRLADCPQRDRYGLSKRSMFRDSVKALIGPFLHKSEHSATPRSEFAQIAGSMSPHQTASPMRAQWAAIATQQPSGPRPITNNRLYISHPRGIRPPIGAFTAPFRPRVPFLNHNHSRGLLAPQFNTPPFGRSVQPRVRFHHQVTQPNSVTAPNHAFEVHPNLPVNSAGYDKNANDKVVHSSDISNSNVHPSGFVDKPKTVIDDPIGNNRPASYRRNGFVSVRGRGRGCFTYQQQSTRN